MHTQTPGLFFNENFCSSDKESVFLRRERFLYDTQPEQKGPDGRAILRKEPLRHSPERILEIA